MKRVFVFITIIILFIFMYFLFFRVNRENTSFVSNQDFFNSDSILQTKENFVVIITSSGCPGNKETMPLLAKNLEKLKNNKIPYYIVADELFNENINNCLDEFMRKYNLNEKIYLMDINKYPKNGGLFNNKERYKMFVKDLTKHDDIPLGYVNYILFKNSNYVDFSYELNDNEINSLRN